MTSTRKIIGTFRLIRANRPQVIVATGAWIACLGLATVALQAQAPGGEFERVIIGQGSTQILPVRITSSEARWSDLAKRAFRLHGAYTLAESGEAFTFDFSAQSGGAVGLTISSGGQVLHQETISQGSAVESLMRAADRAVERTTGFPGFFAGRLAFVGRRTGHREIYTSDLLFTNVRQLTNDRSNAILPSWSPDGRQILYTGYHQTGFPDLFLIDLASGNRTTFASYGGINTGGVFSPDGQQVALILSSTGNAELYVMRADRSGQPRRLTTNSSVESGPTFSPDGRWIAVTSDRLGGPQIFKIAASGGPLRHVATNLSGYCSEPDWNPREPGKLVFTAAVRGTYQLAIHDDSTNRSFFLTSGPHETSEPQWLNDGRHVVYTIRPSGQPTQLHLIDTMTGRSNPLSPSTLNGASQAAFVYPR